MLHSMTAYAQSMAAKHAPADATEFIWEMRSVNHRYLDISVRLPVGFRALEASIRAKVAELIHRGKVDISLALGTTAQLGDELVVDAALLSQLSRAIKTVRESGIELTAVDPVKLLQWPGLTKQSMVVDSTVVANALAAFDCCLQDFQNSRCREGEQITQMLGARVERITELNAQLRDLRPAVVLRQRTKLLDKLAQLEVDHDPSRLHQELVFSAQRLDIDEELDRLGAHVVEFRNALTRNEPVGRRLDFLMQEFNREANTVASKSSDTDSTNVAIELKVLIEQMREQVQNVE